jgi:hypothetical protein
MNFLFKLHKNKRYLENDSYDVDESGDSDLDVDDDDFEEEIDS